MKRHEFERNAADWYKDAIIYEAYVRGFHDSSSDGNGDLRGLIDKLDYLRNLGVDCLWLMPIYESPLKDDGYDIADFRKIHPTIGVVEDFEALTAAAHSAWHPDHRRPGRQPHVGPAPLVPGGPPRPQLAEAGLLRLERLDEKYGTRASSSPTPSTRTGRGTPWPVSTTGTGSSATSRT